MDVGKRGGVGLALAVLAGCHLIGGAHELEFVEPGSGGAPSSNAGGQGGAGGGGAMGGGGSTTTCSEPDQCASALCVDGYCCDTACEGPCEACDVEGREGSCSPLPPAASNCNGFGVCDGQGECVEGEPHWLFVHGDSAIQNALGAVPLGDGVAVAGTFDGTIFSDNHQLSGGPSYVARISAAGAVEWAVRYLDVGGGPGIKSVAVGDAGIVLAVDCMSSTSLRKGASDTILDGVYCGGGGTAIAQLDAAATTATFSSHYEGLIPADVAVRESDGAVAFVAIDNNDSQLVVLHSNLTESWTLPLNGTGFTTAQRVGFDGEGHVIVAGEYTETFALAPSLPSAGSTRALFVVNIDKDSHEVRWAQAFDNSSHQFVGSLAVAPTGAIHVGAKVVGVVDVGGEPLDGTPQGAATVITLSPDGEPQWGRAFPSTVPSYLAALAVGKTGNVAIGGSFGGSITLAGNHTAPSMGHAFVALLASDGTPLWSHADGAGAVTRALAVGDDGTVYAAGQSSSPIGFGLPPSSPNLADLWVARFRK